MRAVDDVRTGYSETYWRAEQGVAARAGGQRWGLPAAGVILGFNLMAFVFAPYLLTRITPAVYVLGTIAPTVLAGVAVLVLSATRGNGPVVDFGLPRKAVDAFTLVRTGIGWGLVALFSAVVVVSIVLATSDASPREVLTGVPVLPLGWRVVSRCGSCGAPRSGRSCSFAGCSGVRWRSGAGSCHRRGRGWATGGWCW